MLALCIRDALRHHAVGSEAGLVAHRFTVQQMVEPNLDDLRNLVGISNEWVGGRDNAER